MFGQEKMQAVMSCDYVSEANRTGTYLYVGRGRSTRTVIIITTNKETEREKREGGDTQHTTHTQRGRKLNRINPESRSGSLRITSKIIWDLSPIGIVNILINGRGGDLLFMGWKNHRSSVVRTIISVWSVTQKRESSNAMISYDEAA